MKRAAIIVAVFLLGGLGYYFISPLFNVQEVNDELPIASGVENLSEEENEERESLMEEANSTEQEAMAEEMPAMEAEPTAYPVMGTIGHPASGTVKILEVDGQTIIRYEDFETINGPSLNLYLAKDLRATEYIDLGPIRGTKGNINYVVPDDVDISEYRYVMYWCVPFAVLFNYADLDG